MERQVWLEKNRYVDSVTLMGVAERVNALPGVDAAECGMGTAANKALLREQGFDVPAQAGKNDLLLAICAKDMRALNAARAVAADALAYRRAARVYHTLDDVAPRCGARDLAQISLPGAYAAAQAKKALEKGMEVLIFSDNVPIEQERALKELGREKGLLVMGPDCGVGLLEGVALAAGSIVRPGGVGIVGASGSGAQEVACLIERMGEGVSDIIGTGGRDLSPEVGGITMRMGMRRLAADGRTKVICLVSKLADRAVMADVLREAETLGKPVVAVFLGADAQLYAGLRAQGAMNLEEAARACVRLLTGRAPRLGWTQAQIEDIAARETARLAPSRRYFRGLYCGGTFTQEALLCFRQENPGIALCSNLETDYARKLANPHVSQGHTLLDLGAGDFTASAPHPVFDRALRLKRLEQELGDKQTAVVLLDFITGPGVHRDPVAPFAEQCERHREVCFIATICGAAGDPQDVAACRERLEAAGAVVAQSNYQSARLAAAMMRALERRA